MIHLSISLERRLLRETQRHAGSWATMAFYNGTMPLRCELQADGERLERRSAPDWVIAELVANKEPELPAGATYWRLQDNNGNVVMQGDGLGKPAAANAA